MTKNLEIILDTEANGGCGCNCGCGGSTIVDDMNDLVSNLQEHDFKFDVDINVLPISDLETIALIDKINTLLDNTSATFRVDNENLTEALSNILPLVVLDGKILTAYGVPTLYDVIMEVEKII